MKWFRYWLIRRLLKTGGWIVQVKEAPRSGYWFRLIDERHHIAYDWVSAYQILPTEWAIINESARKEFPVI